MEVHPSNRRLVSCVAVAAPVADVAGRLLAPTLLASAPIVVVALSPADPHLLLATNESRAVLVAIAFVVRLGRAWAIFRSLDHLLGRRNRTLAHLAVHERRRRWRRRTGIGAVVFLPGMVGAAVAARAKLDPRLFLAVATCSTASGLALTVTASHVFDAQLASASAFLADHPAEFTVLVGALVLAGVRRRRSASRRAGDDGELRGDIPRAREPIEVLTRRPQRD